jgi:hypothetical protein
MSNDMTQTTRGLVARIPLWLRVCAIIALVLAGVLISTTLLDTVGTGGGHQPPAGDTEMDGRDHDPGSGHGPGGQTQRGDHANE